MESKLLSVFSVSTGVEEAQCVNMWQCSLNPVVLLQLDHGWLWVVGSTIEVASSLDIALS